MHAQIKNVCSHNFITISLFGGSQKLPSYYIWNTSCSFYSIAVAFIPPSKEIKWQQQPILHKAKVFSACCFVSRRPGTICSQLMPQTLIYPRKVISAQQSDADSLFLLHPVAVKCILKHGELMVSLLKCYAAKLAIRNVCVNNVKPCAGWEHDAKEMSQKERTALFFLEWNHVEEQRA
jgi:hypothetical protein